MQVNISGLKARLSSYLDAVRRGETVTVLDRRTPIAQIVPLHDGHGGLEIDPASAPPGAIDAVKGVPSERAVDVVAMLADTRGER